MDEATDKSTDTGTINITATNKELQIATGSSEQKEEGNNKQVPIISEKELNELADEIDDGCCTPACKTRVDEVDSGDKASKII